MAEREKGEHEEQQSDRPETQPAEEWGERVNTGRQIATGGKNDEPVPGATEQDG